ncbi:MAG: HNH endonuclease, partial [Deltaproteobacteria bacterium]|nr:HNH endonuclease [Deltaproteobacteria bacterium]
ERAYLEVDHIEPFALGGKAELENLRLLCSTHNRYRAQLTFGKQWRRAFE